MKKFYFWSLLVALPMLTGCSESNEPIAQIEEELLQELPTNAYEITKEEALKIAIPTLKAIHSKELSRANDFTVKSVERINNRYDSRSEGTNGLYLFNFENKGGFALVSADTRDSVSVYLSAADGNVPLEALQDEENGLGFLLNLVENHQEQKIAEYEPTLARDYKDYSHYVNVTTYLDKPSVVSVRWDQSDPFNTYRTDGALMGCVPVAIGQIMTNYKSPANITVNGTQYTFDWEKICSITSYEVAENNLNGAYEVSKLLNAIGEKGNATFDVEGTSVTLGNVYTILDGFGYHYYPVVSFNPDSIFSEVRNNRAVFMSGKISATGDGHAWLAVGATITETEYIAYDTYTGELIENDIYDMYSYTQFSKYIHIHWGWRRYNYDSSYSMYTRTVADLYPTRISVFSGSFYTTMGTFDTDIRIITGIWKK